MRGAAVYRSGHSAVRGSLHWGCHAARSAALCVRGAARRNAAKKYVALLYFLIDLFICAVDTSPCSPTSPVSPRPRRDLSCRSSVPFAVGTSVTFTCLPREVHARLRAALEELQAAQRNAVLWFAEILSAASIANLAILRSTPTRRRRSGSPGRGRPSTCA